MNSHTQKFCALKAFWLRSSLLRFNQLQAPGKCWMRCGTQGSGSESRERFIFQSCEMTPFRLIHLSHNHFWFHHPTQHAHCQCLRRKPSLFRAQPADKVPMLVISEPETLLCSLSLNVRMLSFRTVAIRQTNQSFKSPLVIFIMINSAFGVTFLFLKAGDVDITVKPMPQEVSVSIHLTTCSSITLLQVHIARCLMMMPGNTHQWR